MASSTVFMGEFLILTESKKKKKKKKKIHCCRNKFSPILANKSRYTFGQNFVII